MINELMQLAKSLPLNGDAMAEDKLMPLPKGKTFRVLLTAEGCISDVEVLDEERSATLRKYMPNKFKSFPGFNQLLIPSIDVWQARFEEESKQETESSQRQEVYKRQGIKDDPKKTKEELYEETKEEFYGDKGLYKKAVKGIQSNLINFPKELRGMMKTVILENETLARLLGALSRIEDGQGFLANMEKICYERNFKYDPRKPGSFFFDVDNYNEWPMAHQRSLSRLNEVLCKCENKETVTQKDADVTEDAFGESCAGADSLMRDISLPLLGLVKIRSSNKDVEALSRYHVTGGESFPMGKAARIFAEGALKYVVDAKNENSTYGRVSSKEILIAYPTEMATQQTIPLLRLFGGSNDPKQERLVFNAVAKTVIDLLKGEGQDLPNRELRIFSIRKMDKARTKVVYYRNTDVSSLAHASDAWDDGCHNLPSLDVKDWPKVSKKERKLDTGKLPVPVVVETVFPVRLYQYLNKYYKRDFATENIEVSRFEPSTGIELMLMNEHEIVLFAKGILSQVIIQAGNYFRELCLYVGQNKVSSAKDKGIYLGILGLLLYKIGVRKENYMKETAFLLGKFLRIADGLHKCYCESVRKGQYPSEFCGSSMISAMMENPTSALAQLGQRSAPYVKWAQSYQKENAGLVHWWLNQWQPIVEALHAEKLPTRLSDVERAEVFLGYLASLPKKEDAQTEVKDFETTKTELEKENN